MSVAKRTVSLNKKVTNTGVGTSDWLVLTKGGAGVVSIQVEATASSTITIQGTLNIEIENSADVVPADEINAIQDMSGLTSNGLYTIQGPLKAVRINQTVGAGASAITILQVEGS